MIQRNTENGFTLIELLTVITIVTIIVGMVMTASVNSRRRARKAQVRAEVRQLVTAWRAYYVTYQGESFVDGVMKGTDVQMTADNLAPLLGYDAANNPLKEAFLEYPDDLDFEDPWGNVYTVNFDGVTEVESVEKFKVAVSFPMRRRFHLD